MRILAVLFVLMVALPLQAEIYKCTINGATEFSDQPCSEKAEEQITVHINKASPFLHSSEISMEQTITAKTAKDPDEAIRDKLIGQWRFTGKLLGGSEDRTFYEDGTFKSHGTDDFAETTGTGTWSLDGKKLTITATFENTMSNGGQVTVNNILRQTVKSIDDRVMVIHGPQYDQDSEWVRQ